MSGGDLWIMTLILPPSVTKSRLCRLTTEPVPSCSASWVSLLHLPCLWLINMTKKNKVANTHGKQKHMLSPIESSLEECMCLWHSQEDHFLFTPIIDSSHRPRTTKWSLLYFMSVYKQDTGVQAGVVIVSVWCKNSRACMKCCIWFYNQQQRSLLDIVLLSRTWHTNWHYCMRGMLTKSVKNYSHILQCQCF